MKDIEYIKSRVTKTNSDCWEWNGSKYHGYGKMFRRGRTWFAHKFSYITFYGEIPTGLQINHKCNNSSCVNPEHLYAGTQKQNMKDMKMAGRAIRCKGEMNGNSKLTTENAINIYKENGPARLIAEKYHVSETLVFAIKKKQIWKHIHE